MIYYLASDHLQKNQFNSNVIQTHVPICLTMHFVASFFAHLAKDNVSFCHHLVSVVR